MSALLLAVWAGLSNVLLSNASASMDFLANSNQGECHAYLRQKVHFLSRLCGLICLTGWLLIYINTVYQTNTSIWILAVNCHDG